MLFKRLSDNGFLMLGFSFMLSLNAQKIHGQNLNIPLEDQQFFSRMKEKSITANVLATSDILGGFSQLPSDFNLDLGGDPGLGLVLLQNNFVTTNSDGDSYIWNEIGLNTQIKAAGFPLELGGTLRAFDGEISWERSTVTVNFDVDRMQQEKLAEFFDNKKITPRLLILFYHPDSNQNIHDL
ncbi:MAG: hypothetical protein AAFN93_20835 [Bacteroidota bacterium]